MLCEDDLSQRRHLTHTPAYGQLIALGVLGAAQEANFSPKQIRDAAAYRQLIAGSGRFLTFSAGAATIGYRIARGCSRAGGSKGRS